MPRTVQKIHKMSKTESLSSIHLIIPQIFVLDIQYLIMSKQNFNGIHCLERAMDINQKVTPVNYKLR